MISPKNYPSSLNFPNEFLRQFACELSPHNAAFFHGGILCEPSEGWENVFFHCLAEALTIKIICTEISHTNTKAMVIAAFLHDAYKRREVETVEQSALTSALAFLESEKSSKIWLQSLGYPQDVVHLQSGFGDSAAEKIFTGHISDLDRRILHYVDDITMGDLIVPLEDRMQALEQNPRYAAQNIWHRQTFNGLTLYQAKRIINQETERDLAAILKLKNPNELVPWIKDQHLFLVQKGIVNL